MALPGHSKGGCLQFQAFGGLRELYSHKMGVRFTGDTDRDVSSGDFSFILFPLFSIRRHYVFYIPDEEFPAGLNCLFPANAIHFKPVEGLADLS